MNISHKLSQWAIVTFISIIPWSIALIATDLGGHNYARIAEIIVCTICTLSVGGQLWRKSIHFSGHSSLAPILHRSSFLWRCWLAVVTTFALISVARSPAIAYAAQELALFVGLAAVSLAIASAGTSLNAQTIGRSIVTATLTQNLLILVVLGVGLISGAADPIEGLDLGYDNRRFFNHVQTIALPLTSLIFHQASSSRAWIIAGWVTLITGFSLLWLSGGRGTFLGIAVATLLLPIFIGQLAWRSILPLTLSAVIGYVTYLLLFVQLPSAIGIDSGIGLTQRATEISTARIYLWKLAAIYIEESPWFGVGPMHFAHRPNLKGAHPHNIFLQIAAEWGLPMLALLVLGALTALRRMMQVIRSTSSPNEKCIGGTLFIACIAALLDGLVSGNFVMPVSQVWIAICAGLAARWTQHAPPIDHKQLRGTATALTNRVYAAFLGAMMATQVVLLLSDVLSLDALLIHSNGLSISDRLSPRFWIDGWF